MTYEEMNVQRDLYYQSERADDRVRLAGFFWEQGAPLTDEVLATREYARRKGVDVHDLPHLTVEEAHKEVLKVVLLNASDRSRT